MKEPSRKTPPKKAPQPVPPALAPASEKAALLAFLAASKQSPCGRCRHYVKRTWLPN